MRVWLHCEAWLSGLKKNMANAKLDNQNIMSLVSAARVQVQFVARAALLSVFVCIVCVQSCFCKFLIESLINGSSCSIVCAHVSVSMSRRVCVCVCVCLRVHISVFVRCHYAAL